MSRGTNASIAGYGNVKDNYDSGQFKAIQKAGVYALDHPEITGEDHRQVRAEAPGLVGALTEMGFNAKMPAGTFYLYVKMPKGVKSGRRFANAEEFSEFLITEKLISTVPWDDAGSYIRFSATFESKGKADEQRVLDEFKKRMSGLQFEF